jgi:hypothetical protein
MPGNVPTRNDTEASALTARQVAVALEVATELSLSAAARKCEVGVPTAREVQKS